jgi:hypothetical protein
VTGGLATALTAALRAATRMLPPGRRQWAEAVGAEATAVPAGSPRLRWLGGGLWLVAREVSVGRKIFYWLGIAGLAAAAAWVVWLSWRTSPATDAFSMTDRVRVLTGVLAIGGLPWIGHSRGLFGPVGASITARALRLAGLAGLCWAAKLLVQSDRFTGGGSDGPPRFSLAREIVGVALLAAAAAMALLADRSRVRSNTDQAGATALPARRADVATLWTFAAIAGSAALVALPVQVVTVAAVAAVLALTARGSAVPSGTLVAGAATGLLGGVAAWFVPETPGQPFLLLAIALVSGIPAGAIAAWLLARDDAARQAQIRQGRLAGLTAGIAACLLLAPIGVVVLPLWSGATVLGGVLGGALAADHRRAPRPARSLYGGLFVSKT